MIFSHCISILVREITDELPLGADWAGWPGRPGAKSEGLHGCLEVDMLYHVIPCNTHKMVMTHYNYNM